MAYALYVPWWGYARRVGAAHPGYTRDLAEAGTFASRDAADAKRGSIQYVVNLDNPEPDMRHIERDERCMDFKLGWDS